MAEGQQQGPPGAKAGGPPSAKRPAVIKSNAPVLTAATAPPPGSAPKQAPPAAVDVARRAAAAEAARRLVDEMKAADAPLPRKVKGPAGMPPPKFGADVAGADGGGLEVRSAAAARVAASVALLAGAGAAEAQEEGGVEGGDREVWVPPTDQRGDGRTSLNAKFGY